MDNSDSSYKQLADRLFPETERVEVRLRRDDVMKLKKLAGKRGITWDAFVGIAVRLQVETLEELGEL